MTTERYAATAEVHIPFLKTREGMLLWLYTLNQVGTRGWVVGQM